MGGITIFALAKMTTFSFESGYSIFKIPLISTNCVATFFFESGYFVKITSFYVLPLLCKSATELYNHHKQESYLMVVLAQNDM